MSNATVSAAAGFEYYQDTIYWNSFDVVIEDHNRRISGSRSTDWVEHVLRNYGIRRSAFVFNCGNGWVERDLFRRGLIERVTAFDINSRYADEARSAAEEIGLPARYFVADANRFSEEGLRCDLIVNVGAMHHVAYINRMTQMIARIASEGGIYVGFDYFGAHRNQYSSIMWRSIIETNKVLPEKYRVRLRYPHLPTTLALDPSEAVHSELQIATLLRHFDVLEYHCLGGGIAYTLLYENRRLREDQHTPEGRETLEKIMRADSTALAWDPDMNLFSFFVATSKKLHAVDTTSLLTWQAEEDEREARAAENGGRYYPPIALELLYNELAARG